MEPASTKDSISIVWMVLGRASRISSRVRVTYYPSPTSMPLTMSAAATPGRLVFASGRGAVWLGATRPGVVRTGAAYRRGTVAVSGPRLRGEMAGRLPMSDQ